MRAQHASEPENEPLRLPGLDWLAVGLNGGLRPGAAYGCVGEPGGFKTTLGVQISTALASQAQRVLILLNEQLPRDVMRLARRVTARSGVGLTLDNLRRFQSPQDISRLLNSPGFEPPALLVIDSLQGGGLASTATASYREFYRALDEARRRKIATLTLLQTTKDGKMAGPRSLEHKLDVCLLLRKAANLRQLFVLKNRFGPEIVEPIVLATTKRGLVPSPHAFARTASALAIVGVDLVEVQVSVALPRLGCRGGVNAPYLNTRRLRQIIDVVNQLPGVDLSELSYTVNAFIPDTTSYSPATDLAIAVGILAGFLQQPIPPKALFIGTLDLWGRIRPPKPPVMELLGGQFGCGEMPAVKQVIVSSAISNFLAEDIAQYSDREEPEVIGVSTLRELVQRLWPAAFPE